MTKLQKDIIDKLLIGYYILPTRSNGYRLRSPDHIVVRRFTVATFRSLNVYLRRSKNMYVLNRSVVRQEHGSTWIKKRYKTFQSSKQVV